MQGLTLLPESWYDQYHITCWLNTWALSLDPAARQITLATGDTLPYDRLVLATGSSSFVPRIEGFGLPGTFLLRLADDAMEMRLFAQAHNCRRAVVVGGGALGLEAAYALHKLGIHVTVLERSSHLLHRQVDAAASEMLRVAVEALGIDVQDHAEVAAVAGTDRVRRVIFADGREYPCDLLLVCAGIRPNIALAREAQLATNRGVVVDDTLRTSDPAIFAVGDAAEHRGEVSGLWPAAVKQAEVAAMNVVGGEALYEGTVPVMILKVPGIDLTTIGRIEPGPGEEAVVEQDPEQGLYRKLVFDGSRVVGAIVLGSSQHVAAATSAIRGKADVSRYLAALRSGDWAVLEAVAAASEQ
jgi:NAD(P)H-nitrite reductase large subunit